MNRLQVVGPTIAASSLALSLAGCMHGRAPSGGSASTITVDRGCEGVYLVGQSELVELNLDGSIQSSPTGNCTSVNVTILV